MRGVAYSFLFMRMLQLVCFFGLVFMYAHSPRIGSHALLFIYPHTAHAEPHTEPHRATHSHTKSRTQGRGHIDLIIKVPILVKTKENTQHTHTAYAGLLLSISSVSPHVHHKPTTRDLINSIIIIVITIKHIHSSYIYNGYGAGY